MGFLLPIFSLLHSSILDLGSGTGLTDRHADRQTDRVTDRQTDRQMTAINALCPTILGAGAE